MLPSVLVPNSPMQNFHGCFLSTKVLCTVLNAFFLARRNSPAAYHYFNITQEVCDVVRKYWKWVISMVMARESPNAVARWCMSLPWASWTIKASGAGSFLALLYHSKTFRSKSKSRSSSARDFFRSCQRASRLVRWLRAVSACHS